MGEEIILLKKEEIIKLKKAIATGLYEKGYEQSKISVILDITQPRVSNYLTDKEDIPKKIRDYSIDLIKKIEDGSTPEFLSGITFSKGIEGINIIAKEEDIISSERKELINELTDAFTRLKDLEIKDLIPKVRINIASRGKSNDRLEGIASFSDGLIVLNDKISSMTDIQFGKSKHLASLLLYLNKLDPDINSIMNLKHNEKLKKVFKHSELTKDFKLKEDTNADILMHKGDFGIEPCAYLIGKNAIDIANKLRCYYGSI